ncbi:hypothetical protein TrVE_jg8171 [Triparma verrucosa]|uniref:Uncharacterized protein n=1 Tax=Triparma verrucosa TaxID=1606542 RepID=A0A9W7F6D3_9STRA|nr:hypothetical protein TrVE_jg8171 [Triparma verrucosa]
MMNFLAILTILILSLSLTTSFLLNVSPFPSNVVSSIVSSSSSTSLSSSVDDGISRSSFLKNAAPAALISTIGLVGGVESCSAKGSDAGTKSDPKYTNCMSLCLFSCQKPKGVDQKSRAECIPPCKSECASSKEQLMIGTPKQ